MESLESYSITFSGYINEIEKQGLVIIGSNVHDYVVKYAKYPHTWLPFVKRYKELVTENRRNVYTKQIYTDMLATIIAKQIRIVDLPFVVGPTDLELADSVEFRNYQVTHLIFAKMTIIKLLKCSLECLTNASYDELLISESVKKLYDTLLTQFVNENVVVDENGSKRKRNDQLDVERCIDDIVTEWLLNTVHAIDTELLKYRPEILSDTISFLGVSHIYWLWLHLTAARSSAYKVDFVSLVYNFDFLIYCGECAYHFKENIKPFFLYRGGDICTDHEPSELIYYLHDLINRRNNDNYLDFKLASIKDYMEFWIESDE